VPKPVLLSVAQKSLAQSESDRHPDPFAAGCPQVLGPPDWFDTHASPVSQGANSQDWPAATGAAQAIPPLGALVQKSLAHSKLTAHALPAASVPSKARPHGCSGEPLRGPHVTAASASRQARAWSP
jgi:hypothetical protein